MTAYMSRTSEATSLMRKAVKAQAWVNVPECSDSVKAEAQQLADALSAQAAALLALESSPLVNVGEIVSTVPDTPAREVIADTLAMPSQVTVDASIARTDLLVQVQSNVLALAVDAAHTIGAKNSLEKMLAHQLALLHSVSMRTMDKALLQCRDSDRIGLLNATSRMMDVFQNGLLTIQKLRSKGAQKITVRHVTVQPGGQAVIGDVKSGGPRHKKRVGGHR